MWSLTAKLIRRNPKVARVLDGQPCGADESGQRPLSEREDVVNDLVRWRDFAIAVMPRELG
jgi:hypothetical protein